MPSTVSFEDNLYANGAVLLSIEDEPQAQAAPNRDDEEMRRLVFEREQCRQDDRDVGSRIVQIIIAGVAALAFILALYGNLHGESGDQAVPNAFYFAASLGVIGAAFSYIASLGLMSTLRYRYLYSIEEKLNPANSETVSWVELSSSINTLNMRHLRSSYSVAHFACVVFGAASAGLVCLAVAVFFATQTDFREVLLICVLFLPFPFLFCAATYAALSRADKMYSRACEIALNRRKAASETNSNSGEKTGDQKARELFSLIRYLLYPRPRVAIGVIGEVVALRLFRLFLIVYASGVQAHPHPRLLSCTRTPGEPVVSLVPEGVLSVRTLTTAAQQNQEVRQDLQNCEKTWGAA